MVILPEFAIHITTSPSRAHMTSGMVAHRRACEDSIAESPGNSRIKSWTLMFKSICLWTALLRYFLRASQWVWNVDISWPFRHLDFFYVSDVCWCVWDHHPVAWPSFSQDGLTYVSRIFWYKGEFTDFTMTASFPGPVTVKQTQIINPPPLCLTVGMIWLWCCVWFSLIMFGQLCCE